MPAPLLNSTNSTIQATDPANNFTADILYFWSFRFFSQLSAVHDQAKCVRCWRRS